MTRNKVKRAIGRGLVTVVATASMCLPLFTAPVMAAPTPSETQKVNAIKSEETHHYAGEKNWYSDSDTYKDFNLALNSPEEFDQNDKSNPMGLEQNDKWSSAQTLNELFVGAGNTGNDWESRYATHEETANAANGMNIESNFPLFGGKSLTRSENDLLTSGGCREGRVQTASFTPVDYDGDGTDELAVNSLMYDEKDDDRSRQMLDIYDYNADGSYNHKSTVTNVLGWQNNFKDTDFVQDITFEGSRGLTAMAAGDYDSDGKMELAVYEPTKQKDRRGRIYFYEINPSNGQLNSESINVSLESISGDHRFTSDMNYDKSWYLPICNLTTTKIAGRDDLVVTVSAPNRGCGDNVNHNAVLGIVHNGNVVYRSESELTSGSERMLYPAATDSDLNGNGVEELVVGGHWNTFKKSNKDVGDMSEENNGVQVYCWNTEKKQYEAAWSTPKKVDSNHDVDVGEDMIDPAAVAAAKLITYNNADTLFVEGALYTLNNGQAKTDVQEKNNFSNASFGKFKDYKVNGTYGAFISQAFTGHFVKNAVNEEQICVISGSNAVGQDLLDIDTGFVYRTLQSGEDKEDFEPQDHNLNPNSLSGWNIQAGVTQDNYMNDVDEDDCGTYLAICPMNVDRDTYAYQYEGKDYGWSEPTLYSVFNAVPYWRELDYFNNVPGGETWSISCGTDYNNTGTFGFNIGAYINGSSQWGVGAIGNNVMVGPTASLGADFSAAGSWTRSHVTSDTLAISPLVSQNSAIVFAYPVVNYKYKVHAPETTVTQAVYDALSDEEKEKYKVGQVIPEHDEDIVYTCMLAPTFSSLSVEDYNKLVDKYQSQTSDGTKSTLQKIEYGDGKNQIPQRSIGDPTTYMHDTSQVNDYIKEDDKGRFSANIDTGSSKTLSHTKQNGTSQKYDFSLALNGSLGVAGSAQASFVVATNDRLEIGLKGSIKGGYAHGLGNTQGVTYSTTFSALPQGAKDYGYGVALAMYDLPGAEDLDEDAGDDFTPNNKPYVIDYVVTNGPVPPEVALNLRVLGTTKNSAVLKWDEPANNNRKAAHYDIYLERNGSPVKIGQTKGDETTYTVTGLKPDQAYRFQIRAIGKDGAENSVLSNAVAAYTLSDDGAPVFTKQPTSGVTDKNNNNQYTLEAGVQDDNVTYQWQKGTKDVGGEESFANIDGANGKTYTVTGDDASQDINLGDYRVLATKKGDGYSATYSNVAEVVQNVNAQQTKTTLDVSGANQVQNIGEASDEGGSAEEDYKPYVVEQGKDKTFSPMMLSANVTSGDQPVTSGTVAFYKVPNDSKTMNGITLIDTKPVNNGAAQLSYTPQHDDSGVYEARYIGEQIGGNYYLTSTSNAVDVLVDNHTNLSYQLDGGTLTTKPAFQTITTNTKMLYDNREKLEDIKTWFDLPKNLQNKQASKKAVTAKIKDTLSKKGFTFDKWYLDDSSRPISEIDPHDQGNGHPDGIGLAQNERQIIAGWSPNWYKIHYQLNGGKLTNADNQFTIRMNKALPTPTRDGYAFDGWYLDPAFETPVTRVAQGTDKDVTVYAKWRVATAKNVSAAASGFDNKNNADNNNGGGKDNNSIVPSGVNTNNTSGVSNNAASTNGGRVNTGDKTSIISYIVIFAAAAAVLAGAVVLIAAVNKRDKRHHHK